MRLVQVKGKAQVVAAIADALVADHDTEITMEYGSVSMVFKGTEALAKEREQAQEALANLEAMDKTTMTREARGRYWSSKYHLTNVISKITKRLDHPEKILGRFKRTPAIMWGGK